jgi:hypothetical protein
MQKLRCFVGIFTEALGLQSDSDSAHLSGRNHGSKSESHDFHVHFNKLLIPKLRTVWQAPLFPAVEWIKDVPRFFTSLFSSNYFLFL